MLFEFLKNRKTERLDILFFLTAALSSPVVALICAVFTFLETQDPSALWLISGCCIPFIVLLYLTGRKISYTCGQMLVSLADICILLPCCFFRFGGSHSGIPVCMLLITITAVICLDQKYRKFCTGILLLVICLLFYLEGKYPETVTPLETGSVRRDIIFCVFCGVFVLFYFVDTLMNGYANMMSAKIKAAEVKSRMYRELLEQESDRNSFFRRFRHDVHHHNNVLMELLENGHTQEAIAYLKEYDSVEYTGPGRQFCLNLTLNSILNYMDRLCRKNGIGLSVTADVTEKLPVSMEDLSAIAANILENAVNGAMGSGMEEKEIMFKAVTKGERLTLICENTCSSQVCIRDGMLPGRSVGIESIMAAVNRYDGTIEYEKKEEHRLRCSLLLNLEYERAVH